MEIMDSKIAGEIVYECMFEFNDTQMNRLAEYALKLWSDKRYKKRNKESINV